jgi:hypothetical protein
MLLSLMLGIIGGQEIILLLIILSPLSLIWIIPAIIRNSNKKKNSQKN